MDYGQAIVTDTNDWLVVLWYAILTVCINRSVKRMKTVGKHVILFVFVYLMLFLLYRVVTEGITED